MPLHGVRSLVTSPSALLCDSFVAMGQIIDRISKLAQAYWTDATNKDLDWAEHVLDSEDDELRRAIEELSKSKGTGVPKEIADALRILGLTIDALPPSVKPAYRKAISQWHPDRFVNASHLEQQSAQKKAQEINAAYVLLKAYFRIS